MNNSFELSKEEKEFFNECYPALFNRNVNILKFIFQNQEITNLKLKNLQLELENKRLINELSKQKSKANRNRWWRWLW